MLSAKALATIGMFNVFGCYVLGWLGGRYPKHILLGLTYVLRSLALTVYFMVPATPTSTLIFAGVMGMLWLGVAPLVQGMVAQMFGPRLLHASDRVVPGCLGRRPHLRLVRQLRHGVAHRRGDRPGRRPGADAHRRPAVAPHAAPPAGLALGLQQRVEPPEGRLALDAP